MDVKDLGKTIKTLIKTAEKGKEKTNEKQLKKQVKEITGTSSWNTCSSCLTDVAG